MIGSAVRAARLKAGLTQQQLAKDLELSRQHVNNIERGHGDIPLSTALRLARVLGMAEIPLDDRIVIRLSSGDDAQREQIGIARAMAERIADEASEIARRLSVSSSAKGKGEVLKFPPAPKKLPITFAEENRLEEMKQAIVSAPSSMVEWRTAYLGEPGKYVVPRRGTAAAGHGAVPDESSEEKRRQIPQHYYEERGARDTILLRGDSLADLGYVDRDLLFIRPLTKKPSTDEVVVCRRGGVEAEVLVKVYAIQDGKRWLLSANHREAKRYPPIPITENEQFEVFGVVVGRSGYALHGSLAPRPPKKGASS